MRIFFVARITCAILVSTDILFSYNCLSNVTFSFKNKWIPLINGRMIKRTNFQQGRQIRVQELDIRVGVEISRAKPPKSISPHADPHCLRVKHAIPLDPRIISTGISQRSRDSDRASIKPYFQLN